jgi:hypothetical protein
VSEATIAAVDTACRAASDTPLPDASTIDLRGDAGAALYELSHVWQICIFLRDGDGVEQAKLIPQPIPTESPGLSDETVGPIYQISNASIGGAAIFVVAGDCVGPCASDMRIITDAGQGSAQISSSGTFVAWAPIGPSGLFDIEEGNGLGVTTTS